MINLVDFIQKTFSYYHKLLEDIESKNKSINAREFEVRSMQAFHNILDAWNTLLCQEDIKHREAVIIKLNQTLKTASDIRDLFLEKDKISQQKRCLAICVYNQIDGLIFIMNKQ